MTDATPPAAAASDAPLRLWGGAFAAGPSAALQALSVSIHFDWRLAPYDLQSSRAHARVLHRAGLLDDARAARRCSRRWTGWSGTYAPVPSRPRSPTRTSTPRSSEGSSNGSACSAASCGPGGAATTRSPPTCGCTCATRRGLLDRRCSPTCSRPCSSRPSATSRRVAPGFTHLQRAQPVSFAHELLKHVHALSRDVSRLRDWDSRAACSPLGAGALAGSTLPLDPQATARELGFDDACANSIDAVSDRDFVAEFGFVTALIGVHLSRLGEEVVLWTSKEFGWATAQRRLRDRFVDHAAEAEPRHRRARSRQVRTADRQPRRRSSPSSRVCPSPTTATCRRTRSRCSTASTRCSVLLPAVTGMMATLTFDTDRMAAAAPAGHALATDVAEWLVRQGVPFREAHELSGCVRAASATSGASSCGS